MKLLCRLCPWFVLVVTLLLLFWSWSAGGIVYDQLRADIGAAERVVRLQNFFHQAGSLAPILYVLFVMAEVIIAPIPGLMLYAPGGLLFGPWMGGVLAIIGNTLGAGISCMLARSIGDQWIRRIASAETVEKLHPALEKRGLWLILILRLNPLTSNDLLSYAAGFTRIPVAHVMLATGIGMTPLCLIQSWLSDSVFHRWPHLLWPMLVAGIVYFVVVIVVLARLLRRTQPRSAPDLDVK